MLCGGAHQRRTCWIKCGRGGRDRRAVIRALRCRRDFVAQRGLRRCPRERIVHLCWRIRQVRKIRGRQSRQRWGMSLWGFVRWCGCLPFSFERATQAKLRGCPSPPRPAKARGMRGRRRRYSGVFYKLFHELLCLGWSYRKLRTKAFFDGQSQNSGCNFSFCGRWCISGKSAVTNIDLGGPSLGHGCRRRRRELLFLGRGHLEMRGMIHAPVFGPQKCSDRRVLRHCSISL